MFIIVVEFLAIKIRHDPQISGILETHSNFSDKDSKLLQYADDMNLLLKTTQCIARALEITEEFETFTGLKELERQYACAINWLLTFIVVIVKSSSVNVHF